MFEKNQWYAFCDVHKLKLEKKKVHGMFFILDEKETCDWNRDFSKKMRCRDRATWEFIPK